MHTYMCTGQCTAHSRRLGREAPSHVCVWLVHLPYSAGETLPSHALWRPFFLIKNPVNSRMFFELLGGLHACQLWQMKPQGEEKHPWRSLFLPVSVGSQGKHDQTQGEICGFKRPWKPWQLLSLGLCHPPGRLPSALFLTPSSMLLPELPLSTHPSLITSCSTTIHAPFYPKHKLQSLLLSFPPPPGADLPLQTTLEVGVSASTRLRGEMPKAQNSRRPLLSGSIPPHFSSVSSGSLGTGVGKSTERNSSERN